MSTALIAIGAEMASQPPASCGSCDQQESTMRLARRASEHHRVALTSIGRPTVALTRLTRRPTSPPARIITGSSLQFPRMQIAVRSSAPRYARRRRSVATAANPTFDRWTL
jgi:hypothetical protein